MKDKYCVTLFIAILIILVVGANLLFPNAIPIKISKEIIMDTVIVNWQEPVVDTVDTWIFYSTFHQCDTLIGENIELAWIVSPKDSTLYRSIKSFDKNKNLKWMAYFPKDNTSIEIREH